MKRFAILSLACCLVCFWGASALAITPEAQPKVITSASKNLVEIGLSYSGDKNFLLRGQSGARGRSGHQAHRRKRRSH